MKPRTTSGQAESSSPPRRPGLSRAMLVVGGLIIGSAVLVAMFERGAFRRSVPEDAVPSRKVVSAASPKERTPVPPPTLPQPAPANPTLTNPAPAERPSARSETKLVLTQIKAQKYVEEAYPAWRRAHPGQDCPQKLIELNEYMEDKDTNDAWGHPMRMRCSAAQQSGTKGIKVTSYGRDGERSEDDIRFGD
jgi:hypothetical protein